MRSRLPVFTGVFLIAAGAAILLRQYYEVDIYFVRSYGFCIVGILGLLRGLSTTPRRGIYPFSLLLLVGLYYLLGEWGMFYIDQGLTLSVLIMLVGLAFYPLFFLSHRNWKYLLYGNLMILVGLLFLIHYFGMIPPEIFLAVVDDYWPVGIIIICLAYLISALFQSRNHPASHNSN